MLLRSILSKSQNTNALQEFRWNRQLPDSIHAMLCGSKSCRLLELQLLLDDFVPVTPLDIVNHFSDSLVIRSALEDKVRRALPQQVLLNGHGTYTTPNKVCRLYTKATRIYRFEHSGAL